MTLSNSQSSSGTSNADTSTQQQQHHHRSSTSSSRHSASGVVGGAAAAAAAAGNQPPSARRSDSDRTKNPRNLLHSNQTVAEKYSRTSLDSSYRSSNVMTPTSTSDDLSQSTTKSKDQYVDESLYKTAPEFIDPSIISRGPPLAIRRYTRSALYLLRNDNRSRYRPKCTSKLQVLCIWKTSNSSYAKSSSIPMEVTASSPRRTTIRTVSSSHDDPDSLQHPKHYYLDHRSISSSHLMPAFAKRRIGNPMGITSPPGAGPSAAGAGSEPMKVQGLAGAKNPEHNKFVSPQRKTTQSHSSDGDRDGMERERGDNDRDRERDRDRTWNRDRDLSSSTAAGPTARERRIGSGRLQLRDVNWDYPTEKDTSTSEKNPPSGFLSASSDSNNTSSNSRYENTRRSPTSKDSSYVGNSATGPGVKNPPPPGRQESRFDSRRSSFARGDYERDNRGDNSNYVRRFMSDLMNQNANNNFPSQKSGGENSRRRNNRNVEPEWFSGGPTSQHDTIELRGFDEVEDSNSNSSGSIKGRISKPTSTKNDAGKSPKGSENDLRPSSKMKDEDIYNHSDDEGNIMSREMLPDNNFDAPPIHKTAGGLIKTESESQDAMEQNNFLGKPDDKQADTQSQNEDKQGFNFDAFLNEDSLNNLLLLGDQSGGGEKEAGSRFSRWFGQQADNTSSKTTTNGDTPKPEENIVSAMLEEKPQLTSVNLSNQSNTLMEFLQRGKMNKQLAPGRPNSHLSLEELEARMRKVGTDDVPLIKEQPDPMKMHDNPLNQFLANNNVLQHQQQHQHQQQQQQQLQQQVKPPNASDDGHPIHHPQHIPIFPSHSIGHNLVQQQTQDMDAFKKLLEQITPAGKPPTNIKQTIAPLQQQQQQMHRPPPPPALSMPPPPHFMKNDELTKFIHQQQQQQQQVQHGPQLGANINQQQQQQQPQPNDHAMFLAPQQRFEAQLLLQGLSRGEVTQSALGQQLANPNISPRRKEVLVAVLKETSRDTSPNVIMPPGQQIMSPVLGGQGHTNLNIPSQPPPLIIPGPPINHPIQPIPSPRELQYHTQSIMQNALIKKKLEEQQENFRRRRQEIQKQQQQQQQQQQVQHKPPSQGDGNDFGNINASQQQQQQHQQQYSQNQQHAKTQQQQRHVNSPTPLAFTPTSVLRKMTAEKDSVGGVFHAASSSNNVTRTANTSPLMVATNSGPGNSNSNKPMHSLLMHFQQQQQQQQQTNASQNQPRMILGVGSHSQQQQQQGMPILSGPPIQQQQQHQDNSRLNQNLRNNNPMKWTGPGATIVNQVPTNKPMGRPILKGNLTQQMPNAGLNPIHQQQPPTPQMAFASKIEFQQIQQQRAANNQQQQQLGHSQQQQQQQQKQQQPLSMPPQQQQQQQSQNIIMTQLYQQRAALQRVQQYQFDQLHQQQQQQQQQQMNLIQNNGNRPDRSGNNAIQSACGNIINYQRDGGLSPTSNQLARWFSPELLAQASAGKLPLLNMNQALSLEEFEKSIQHSSTAANN